MQHPVSSQVLSLLKETFEGSEGIYLDRQSSLLETLNGVTAEQASVRFTPKGSNVAAHVQHMLLYLRVLAAVARGEPDPQVDWEDIWRNTGPVTPDEWDALRWQLREAYGGIQQFVQSQETWDENALGGALAILAHNAYHLGAIRQILFVVHPSRSFMAGKDASPPCKRPRRWRR